MPPPPRLYRRLTRTLPGLLAWYSLWSADDHLLQVTSNGFSEKYQRFYFRDIKALWIMRTGRYQALNGVSGGVAALAGIPMIFSLLSTNFSFFSLACFVTALGGLILNLILGPTCRVYVLTGIQTEPLRVLTRTGRARKALARIEDRIRDFQISLVPPPLTPAPAAAPIAAPAAEGVSPAAPAAVADAAPLPLPAGAPPIPAPVTETTAAPPPAAESSSAP